MAKKRSISKRIGIRDRLGQLTYRGALRLMDDDREMAEKKLRQGSALDIDPSAGLYLGGDTFRANVVDVGLPAGQAIVTAVEMTSKPQGLVIQCDTCDGKCDHVAAALGLILDNKLAMGLATAPDPKEPLENLTEDELLARALAERQQRARTEKMRVQSLDKSTPWTDYTLTSRNSGRSYRVSIRGFESGQSYCSCPDFRTNHLGTCKHILNVQTKIRKRFTKKQLNKPYRRKHLSLRVDYGRRVGLKFNLPHQLSDELRKILGRDPEAVATDVTGVVRKLRRLERGGHTVHVYPDAEEFLEQRSVLQRLESVCGEIRQAPGSHPLRRTLLKTDLLPYQMDGIAFATGAGRAILADDMGLGKTIQGIGVAELLAREAGIERVLVVCPASLKSQWRNEIGRFSNRTSQVVVGSAVERREQYETTAFFTIVNYEQVLRDHPTVEQNRWDLIILDEGQRIKNWESKTNRVINSLKSPYALVLSGTPLENRLEELYSVVNFVDDKRLGPAYRFFHTHRVVDDRGRIEAYKNLNEVRERLKPLLLRRTRADVLQELPERTTDVVKIPATHEQLLMSNEFLKTAAQIAAKKYLTELDLLRLQKTLLMARLAANGTAFVDRAEPGYSSKLEHLEELLVDLAAEPGRKVVLFSEWTRVLDHIEPMCTKAGLDFVRLDGSVPQKKRQMIVHEFQHSAECRLIMMTNAGSTGLNLQAANTVINVDLPWNPAVLEQRIARAHRMGQERPVHVYVLVSEGTIEERMLGILSDKHDLALAALDVNSDVDLVEFRSGISNLKDRLERLLGGTVAAPVDESERRRMEAENKRLQEKRDRVAAVSGELLGAAMSLVGELVSPDHEPADEAVTQVREGLSRMTEQTDDGKTQLRLTLESDEQLNRLATSLARLLVVGKQDF